MAGKPGKFSQLSKTEEPDLDILIVSSGEKLPLAIESALKGKGFRSVDIMSNGLEALKRLIDQPCEFLIVDMEVDLIDGWMLVKEAKHSEKIQNIPTILTGSGKAPDADINLAKYGVSKFLRFPFAPSELDFLISSTLSIHRTSGTAENKYSIAKAALIEHETDKAIDQFRELKGISKGAARSAFGLAHAYVQNEDYDKADAELSQVADADQASPEILAMRINVMYKKADYESARPLIDQVLELTEDKPFYYSQFAALSLEHGQTNFAVTICEKAVEKNFPTPEFLVLLAKGKFIGEDVDGCLMLAEKALKQFGNTKEIANIRGVCYRRKGDYQTAIQCYEQALEISPMDARIYFNLGITWQANGEPVYAKEMFEMCLQINPNFTKAKNKLEEINATEAAS